MAQIDIGKIKMVWKGAWNSATAYTKDDAVSHSGSSYICIQAGTNQNPATATAYWELMAQAGTNGTNGTNGTDLGTTLTTQGDIVYRDGSGLQRLAAGTNGQALITGGAGANPSWGTISSGNYSVHAFDRYNYHSVVSYSNQTDYIDIAGGNYLTFNPTSTDDMILFMHGCAFYTGSNGTGVDTYLMMGTSTGIGASDTKLNFDGQHNKYYTNSGAHEYISKTFYMPCTGLTVGTNYYVEQAGSRHSGGAAEYNYCQSNCSGYNTRHFAQLIHFKKN